MVIRPRIVIGGNSPGRRHGRVYMKISGNSIIDRQQPEPGVTGTEIGVRRR